MTELNLIGLQILLLTMEEKGFNISPELASRIDKFYDLCPDERYDKMEIVKLFEKLNLKIKATSKGFRVLFKPFV